MTKYYWTCVGSVRGRCYIAHRTEEAAFACCRKDNRDVKVGHGEAAYSDRRPVRCDDPEAVVAARALRTLKHVARARRRGES